MLFANKVLFALISSPIPYIGNVSNLPPKRGPGGGGGRLYDSPPLLSYPLIIKCRNDHDFPV